MRILVTGGAGFIGSHLCERLLRHSHEVAILDDLNSYYAPELKRLNLEIVQDSGPVRFVEGDICDQSVVAALLRSHQPEAIVHLAARAGVRPSLEDPVLYARVNVEGTTVMLEQARRAGVKKFIFASSSSVYGNANRLPFSEHDSVNLPISPYAATKIAGEKICYTFAHLYGLRCVCLRFFTVYGPRQRPDLAIRKFMERIDAGKPIPVFGDGSMSRDYTFVSDAVDGIMAALHHDCAYDVFNLGNSSPVLLSDMIRTLEEALGKTAMIDRQQVQPGDVEVTFADLEKSRRILGYNPKTSFQEGIRMMADWHRRNT
ncbi:MAG: GDP-mannose 4,6-dehydratase [Acidobacteria bacterium]|nr:GDP-mannose 4,6-dehydratase [Acidobacteriota bacterium]